MFVLNLVVVIICLFVLYLLLRPVVAGAIYFPTTPENTEIIMRLAGAAPGRLLADLGSGDGRLLIAAARLGARAEGFEVNPILVLRSRRAIRRAGLEKLAVVHWRSFWRADLAKFDAVTVYGITYIMQRLRKKLARELQPGAAVVSNVFEFPGWKSARQEGNVFLYISR